MKKRILSLLVLLVTAATGAWATDYTTLALGDVIKVGDTFTPTAESQGAFNDIEVENGETYTLMRADVDNDYNVTEKTDGAYYVFKYDAFMSMSPYMHFNKAFAVTAISDGLEVTNIEPTKGKLLYTLALHEPADAPIPTSYSVSLKSGTEDVASWQGKAGTGDYQSLPLTGVEAGTAVSFKYFGTKKVESVKAVKKAALIVNPEVGQIIGSDGKNYDANATLPNGVTKVAMIAYVSGSNGLAIALADEGSMNWSSAMSTCGGKTAIGGNSWKLPSQDEWKNMFKAFGGNESSYSGLQTAITNAGGTALQHDKSYWSSTENTDYTEQVLSMFIDMEEDNTVIYNYGRMKDADNVLVRPVLAF